MQRVLFRLLLVALCGFSASAHAVGLGEAKLRSALNQPLLAEIPLKGVERLDIDQLRAGMASMADFKRLSVEKTYFLNRIAFAVKDRADGSMYLQLSSEDPVIEPYLNFVVELRWPNGRILREYTFLLDLPSFSEAPAAKYSGQRSASLRALDTHSEEATANAGSPAPQPVVAPGAAEARIPSTAPVYDMGDSYTVKKRDMLWAIAARALPSSSVSTQQTVIALAEKNPQAFIRGDINLLRVGAVLALPSESEVAAISRSVNIEAYRASKLRGEQLSAAPEAVENSQAPAPNNNAPRLSLVAAPPKASAARDGADEDADQSADQDIASTSGPAPGPEDEDILPGLSTSGTEDNAGERETALKSDASGDSVESEAASTALESERARAEKAEQRNDELMARLEKMEAQLANMEKLLNVKSEQLAGLASGSAGTESVNDVNVAVKPVSDVVAYWELLLVDMMESPGPALKRAWGDVREGNGPFASKYYLYWLAVALFLLLLLLILRRRPKANSPRSEEVDAELDEALFSKQMEMTALDKGGAALAVAGAASVAADTESSPVDLADGPDTGGAEESVSAEEERIEAPEELNFDAMGVEEIPPEAESETEPASDIPPQLDTDEANPLELDEDAAAFFAELDADDELEDIALESENVEAVSADKADDSDAPSDSDTSDTGLSLAELPEAGGSREVAQGFSDLDSLDGEENEAAAKLSLARVYIDMGDSDEARSLLEAVLNSGDEAQRSEAQNLLTRL